MNNLEKYNILLIIVVVCLVIYVIFSNFTKQGDIDTQKAQIDILNRDISKLREYQAAQDNRIASFTDHILQLDGEIMKSKDRINKLKEDYAKKIQAANYYNANELDSFFTNRYK